MTQDRSDSFVSKAKGLITETFNQLSGRYGIDSAIHTGLALGTGALALGGLATTFAAIAAAAPPLAIATIALNTLTFGTLSGFSAYQSNWSRYEGVPELYSHSGPIDTFLLEQAAKNADQDIVTKLISEGSDVNQRKPMSSILHLAIKR